jgi:hypothetical protein
MHCLIPSPTTQRPTEDPKMALQDGCVAKQRREGRHATLGQPRYALIWNTTTLHYLPGYQCHLDKCPFEVIMTDENQMDQYTKKPTRMQCTDEGMANELSLLCPGDHHHLPLEGSSPGVGNRAAASAVYQGVLCSCIVQEIVNLIIYQEHGQTLMTHERIHAGDDTQVMTTPMRPHFLRSLTSRTCQRFGLTHHLLNKTNMLKFENAVESFNVWMIVMTITKLHRYLGHPCNRNIPA